MFDLFTYKVSMKLIPEMTEEAEKLINQSQEEKDEDKEDVEKRDHDKEDMEALEAMETFDLVILGASGFTGSKSLLSTSNFEIGRTLIVKYNIIRQVCCPVRVQSCKGTWNKLGSCRYFTLLHSISCKCCELSQVKKHGSQRCYCPSKDHIFCITGRNESKLRSVLKDIGEKLETDISDTPVRKI